MACGEQLKASVAPVNSRGAAPIPFDEAQKLFTEQTPLWVQFMEGVGIKPE
jgi:hypothetical protein